MAMKVHDVMTQGCECIAPEKTLQEAAERMKVLDVGPLPVCDNDRITGMITDRDIVLRSVARGDDPTEARVCDAMTPAIEYCFEDDEVESAARQMTANRIRRLPVLDRDKRLVGIVSLGDIAVGAGDDRLSGKTLDRISEPAIPHHAPLGV
jgi:CBS domain-containing protein